MPLLGLAHTHLHNTHPLTTLRACLRRPVEAGIRLTTIMELSIPRNRRASHHSSPALNHGLERRNRVGDQASYHIHTCTNDESWTPNSLCHCVNLYRELPLPWRDDTRLCWLNATRDDCWRLSTGYVRIHVEHTWTKSSCNARCVL